MTSSNKKHRCCFFIPQPETERSRGLSLSRSALRDIDLGGHYNSHRDLIVAAAADDERTANNANGTASSMCVQHDTTYARGPITDSV